MKFLLDTNVFLWYVNGDSQIPYDFIQTIDDDQNEIYLSIASLWEITIKHSKGSLVIHDDLESFLKKNVEAAGINVLPVEIKHLLQLNILPFIHHDPFDRLILSQALSDNINFLFTDQIFEQYLTKG